ncbi:MAG: hypothetical protein U5L08_14695 [Xanthomonadales bacterium]|nr:hypothetical protein [Xanthomonadales bacterium]
MTETDESEVVEETVRWRLEAAVAWITLDRPQVKNAVTYAQRERLIGLLEHAAADPRRTRRGLDGDR